MEPNGQKYRAATLTMSFATPAPKEAPDVVIAGEVVVCPMLPVCCEAPAMVDGGAGSSCTYRLAMCANSLRWFPGRAPADTCSSWLKWPDTISRRVRLARVSAWYGFWTMKSKRMKSADRGIMPRMLWDVSNVAPACYWATGAITYKIGVYGSTSMKRVSSMTALAVCTSLWWHSS